MPSTTLRLIVQVTGEQDSVTVGDLRDGLRRAAAAAAADPTALIEADLAAVTFMNCHALGALVEAKHLLGDRFQLRAPSVPVRRLLELTGLTALFHPTVPGDEPDTDQERNSPTVRASELEDQGADLRDATARRVAIDQAKGVLMGSRRCTAGAAWDLMLALSRDQQVPVREVAAALTATAAAGDPAAGTPALRDALKELLGAGMPQG